MTVLAINGSPRANGNTFVMLNWVLEELKKENIEGSIENLGKGPVQGCIACFTCAERKDGNCAFKDNINRIINLMPQAEAIIIGSPVYFADLTPSVKALIDRAGFVDKNNQNKLKRKLGAAVVVARRAGHVHTYDSINHFFGITEMITVGSSYWNLGVALDEGSVVNDKEAKTTMQDLGQNLAWLIKKIRS
jgi:multimeric flavodoxin WrbA